MPTTRIPACAYACERACERACASNKASDFSGRRGLKRLSVAASHDAALLQLFVELLVELLVVGTAPPPMQPRPHGPPVASDTAAPAGVAHSGLAQAEPPQKRVRCDIDPELMWCRLAELMEWKT